MKMISLLDYHKNGTRGTKPCVTCVRNRSAAPLGVSFGYLTVHRQSYIWFHFCDGVPHVFRMLFK